MQQMYHAGWVPTGQAPGFTPGFQPPQPHEAGGPGLQSADSTEWAQARHKWQPVHSSDSNGLPPPIRTRRFITTRDRRELNDINHRLGNLDVRIGEIQNTLNTHV